MIITIIFSLLAIFLAGLGSYTNNRRFLKLSFLVIFIFLALRYDFGNDYMVYFDYHEFVNNLPFNYLINFPIYKDPMFMEVGYTWINKIFPDFFLMVAVLSGFSCFVYYKLIKDYATISLLWFSIFIFLFDPYLMLVQSSAIRQTVAISLFIYSVQYLINRNFWKYSLLIITGSLFHISALVLLPMYFIVTPSKWNKKILVILLFIFIVLALFGNYFLDFLENFALVYFPSYYESYLIDIIANPLGSGIGFLIKTYILLQIMWAHNKGNEKDTVISKLSIIAGIMYPLGIYLSMFNRIEMYFTPFIIISLPFALMTIKAWQYRIIVITFLIFFYSYLFYNFFQDPIWQEKFSIYKTIIGQGF